MRCSRVQQAHFERWPTLFVAAVNENFAGQKSELAESRALCIADTFARLISALTDQTILSKTAFRETTGHKRNDLEVRSQAKIGRVASCQTRFAQPGLAKCVLSRLCGLMQTPEFAESLEQLIKLANQAGSIDVRPRRCHRWLIADALTVVGIRTYH